MKHSILIEYLLFLGSSLYLAAALIHLYMFLRTLGKKDGAGLLFLRVITLGTFVGSFVVYLVRVLSEAGVIGFLEARAIAVINPLILVVIALYLNFLFHYRNPRPSPDDIKEIKQDVKEVKKDVKVVKKKVA